MNEENEEEVCEDCGGTGEVTIGQFDDIETKKCHCQLEGDDFSGVTNEDR